MTDGINLCSHFIDRVFEELYGWPSFLPPPWRRVTARHSERALKYYDIAQFPSAAEAFTELHLLQRLVALWRLAEKSRDRAVNIAT